MSLTFQIGQSSDGTYFKILIWGVRLRLPRPAYLCLKWRISRRIRQSDVVHLMVSDKFTRPFVDFLNRNFDYRKHTVLCYPGSGENSISQDWFPMGENVYPVHALKRLDFSRARKIIVHSIFDEDVIELFYRNPVWLSKAYWQMWGPDLYKASRDEKNDYVRSHFAGYIGKNDEAYVREKYKPAGRFFDATYNFPISKEMLDNAVKQTSTCTRIQINNSCSASTLPMLRDLARFRDKDIVVTTILSYGDGEMQHKDAIITLGNDIFGNKFTYIGSYLPPDIYANHLAQNDILILCQNRQQGVGTALASLYLGQKVYIRSDVSTSSYLEAKGIVIYDSEAIRSLTFREFCVNNAQGNNRDRVGKFLDDKWLASRWNLIFTDDPNLDRS